MPRRPDIAVESHGSIFLLQPQNEQAVLLPSNLDSQGLVF